MRTDRDGVRGQTGSRLGKPRVMRRPIGAGVFLVPCTQGEGGGIEWYVDTLDACRPSVAHNRLRVGPGASR